MKLPRDVSGAQLIKALRVPGYEVTRQRGSHIHRMQPEELLRLLDL